MRLSTFWVWLAALVAGGVPSGAIWAQDTTDPIDTVSARAAAAQAADGLPEFIRASLTHPQRPVADMLRDPSRQPGRVIEFFDVQPGDRVLNVMGRDGYYAEILARAVAPAGHVLFQNSFDWAYYLRTPILNRLSQRLPGMAHYVAPRDHLALAPNSIDVALCILCYHEIYFIEAPYAVSRVDEFSYVDRDRFLSGIFDALKPGGYFGIVDHQAAPGTGQEEARRLHRINDQLVREELEAAGFEFLRSASFLRNPSDQLSVRIFASPVWENTDRWIMLFVKPASD